MKRGWFVFGNHWIWRAIGAGVVCAHLAACAGVAPAPTLRQACETAAARSTPTPIKLIEPVELRQDDGGSAVCSVECSWLFKAGADAVLVTVKVRPIPSNAFMQWRIEGAPTLEDVVQQPGKWLLRAVPDGDCIKGEQGTANVYGVPPGDPGRCVVATPVSNATVGGTIVRVWTEVQAVDDFMLRTPSASIENNLGQRTAAYSPRKVRLTGPQAGVETCVSEGIIVPVGPFLEALQRLER